VRAVADRAGPVALTHLWDGPETLPREGEIEAPERWITRVLGPTATDGTARTAGSAAPGLEA
jgi:zinicin-like metallopeptidase